MSGYVYMLGHCLVCKRPFSFNPLRVPSHPARGGVPVLDDPTAPKEPICSECIVLVNKGRRDAGNPEFPVHADAYEPVAEGEL